MKHEILGDGVAGMSAAEVIRGQDPKARIIIVSDDPQPFYYRAALTNYLMGELSDGELWGFPVEAWERLGLERVAGRVEGLHPQRKALKLNDGTKLSYDRLLIATGARARCLTDDPRQVTPGATLPGVLALRTLADTRRLLERLPATRRAIVLGSGILGIEIAQGLAERKIAVTILHRGPWLLERVVDRRAGELITLRMTRAGIDVWLGARLARIEGKKGAEAIVLEDGTRIPAELVVTPTRSAASSSSRTPTRSGSMAAKSTGAEVAPSASPATARIFRESSVR